MSAQQLGKKKKKVKKRKRKRKKLDPNPALVAQKYVPLVKQGLERGCAISKVHFDRPLLHEY